MKKRFCLRAAVVWLACCALICCAAVPGAAGEQEPAEDAAQEESTENTYTEGKPKEPENLRIRNASASWLSGTLCWMYSDTLYVKDFPYSGIQTIPFPSGSFLLQNAGGNGMPMVVFRAEDGAPFGYDRTGGVYAHEQIPIRPRSASLPSNGYYAAIPDWIRPASSDSGGTIESFIVVDFTESYCFDLLDVYAKDFATLRDCRYIQYNHKTIRKLDGLKKKWEEDYFHFRYSESSSDYLSAEPSASRMESFGDTMGRYALKYGVSDEGSLEIQLVYSENGTDTVYHHFPLEYEWDFWKYAISGSGAVAWADPSTGRLFISDGENEIALPEDQRTFSCFTWLNDTTLLYLNDGAMGIDRYIQDDEYYKKHPLMAYHTDTGLCEAVRSDDGHTIFIKSMVHDAAVDPSGTMLAYGMIEGSWSNIKFVTLAVTSLVNGETQYFSGYTDSFEMSSEDDTPFDYLYAKMELAWLP